MLRLANRNIIKVEGASAAQFLHNITTNDVSGMKPLGSIYTLILNSKGRYLFDFFLIRCDDYFLIECEHSDTEDLTNLLRMYRLQLKVRIKVCDEYIIAASISQTIGESGYTKMDESGTIVFQDPRNINMGVRAFIPISAKEEYTFVSDSYLREYDILRIRNTVPDCISEMIRGESFPLHFSMDRLNAICTNKGCYIGQEVTARMHRIGSKKMLYTVESRDGSFLPHEGKVYAEEHSVGNIIFAIEDSGLCVLEKEKVEQGCDIKVDGTSLKIFI